MAASFFWYDLETSGISPRSGRIMQFAGQRTSMDLQPVGDPVNVLIRLSDDVLPDPDAIMVTGITPQSTVQDGVSEAAFLRLFYDEVATPETIFVGYNTVRFDDEFMRFLNYRNFYDAYGWQYQDGKSRWDLLDVVRMTRALRPDGINWPMTEDGKPTNRLELITKLNGLDHEYAHDALNDVLASIALAKLIQDKQPKLFDWLLSMRDKKAVKSFVTQKKTFVYSSGKFSNDTEKTAVVQLIDNGGSKDPIVYDLRFDPTEFAGLSAEELADRWRWTKDPDAPARLPVKTMKYNRCPAISPTGALSDLAVQQRLHVTPGQMQANRAKLAALPQLVASIVQARDLLDDERGERWKGEAADADSALYDGGFFDDADKRLMQVVRTARPEELGDLGSDFHDARLQTMLPRYKARNYPESLTNEERTQWERHRAQVLLAGGESSALGKFMHRLQELSQTPAGTEKRYLLEELQLYAESIIPVDTAQ